jgi:hypothetical protein
MASRALLGARPASRNDANSVLMNRRPRRRMRGHDRRLALRAGFRRRTATTRSSPSRAVLGHAASARRDHVEPFAKANPDVLRGCHLHSDYPLRRAPAGDFRSRSLALPAQAGGQERVSAGPRPAARSLGRQWPKTSRRSECVRATNLAACAAVSEIAHGPRFGSRVMSACWVRTDLRRLVTLVRIASGLDAQAALAARKGRLGDAAHIN